MIFSKKEKTYNVFVSIATNIPQRHKTGEVVFQGIYIYIYIYINLNMKILTNDALVHK